jgi:pSer/pThr/pTyr-binding forkhead associated (FHA) protein
MPKITLYIETPYQTETVNLEDEISVGRTTRANIALDDIGLSGINTTFFVDGNKAYVVDENSLNGTYLNGEKLGTRPKMLIDGDVLKLGSETRIKIEVRSQKPEARSQKAETDKPKAKEQNTKNDPKPPKSQIPNPKSNNAPMMIIMGIASIFLIVFTAGILFLFFGNSEQKKGDNGKKKSPPIASTGLIPIRVIDPLGGQTPEDLQELSQLWEVQEKEVEAEDLQDVTASETTGSENTNQPKGLNLKVSVEFWKQQKAIALAARNSPTGNDPPGTAVPRELFGDGVIKQKAKIREMQRRVPPYSLPMDFAELVTKRMKGELVELPMATDAYVLEVGGSSTTGEFTNFDFKTGSTTLAPGSPDYMILAQLASDFSGERYDLSNPDHRRQMKIRLLRMFTPRAFPVLEKLAKNYHQKFGRPLRVTSLSRSMEYQISLNKTNPNSFTVRGEGSLPPHTSGCAFDLARKHMTAEEQNFVMAELAQMEQQGILDALREGNLNACFHVFIYDDGIPPKM